MKFVEYIKIIKLNDIVEFDHSTYRVHSCDLCPGISVVRFMDLNKSETWPGILLRSNGKGLEDDKEIKLINIKQTTYMKITNLVKKILDEDTRKLVKANFINGDLALTDEGVQELLGLLFLTNKDELVKIADEKIKETN